MRKGGKTGRNYEDEEWRTVYIGFVERGTSSEDLAKIFKVGKRSQSVPMFCNVIYSRIREKLRD